MFSLKYKIPMTTKENLLGWNLVQFEEEIGEIEGQIQLDFNGEIYGGIDEDDCTFYNTLLISWFIRLNECCNYIKKKNYVCFNLPETYIWLEMNVDGDAIYVRRFKFMKEKITNYVMYSPLSDFTYLSIRPECINKNEFIDSVKSVTEHFLNEICGLNHNLKNSIAFKKLIEKIR